jgi:hypothetical protein
MEEKLDCHFKESMDDRPVMSLKKHTSSNYSFLLHRPERKTRQPAGFFFLIGIRGFN